MNLPENYNEYLLLSPWERIEKLFEEFDQDRILVTSSFGSTSALLLHMINKVKPGHPIHFINTSFLFKETIEYKNHLTEKLNLNVVEIKAKENRQRFTVQNNSWQYNQDLCCFINKVEPINRLKLHYDIWISGLLAYQNANRSKMGIFQSKRDIVKFHPILDMTREEVNMYNMINELPKHELVNQGFDSIGCTHCTKKGKGRAGRWANSDKTECGLHV